MTAWQDVHSDMLKDNVAKNPHRETFFLLVMMVITLTLAVLTVIRNAVWQDDLVLWRSVVQKSPGKARPHYGAGFASQSRGLLPEAITEYRIALQLDPGYDKARNNLGSIYGKLGVASRTQAVARARALGFLN